MGNNLARLGFKESGDNMVLEITEYLEEIRSNKIDSYKLMDKRRKLPKKHLSEIIKLNKMIGFLKSRNL